MALIYEFSGIWHSKYRVRSGPERKVIETEHDVVMYHHDDHLIVESLPSSGGPYMMARFTLDGRIATGTYHSQNSPKSAAKKAIYYGAAQLILDKDGNALRGKGVGFGKDMKVKTSDWELVRTDKDFEENSETS
jgi:hypothetical protein